MSKEPAEKATSPKPHLIVRTIRPGAEKYTFSETEKEWYLGYLLSLKHKDKKCPELPAGHDVPSAYYDKLKEKRVKEQTILKGLIWTFVIIDINDPTEEVLFGEEHFYRTAAQADRRGQRYIVRQKKTGTFRD